MKTRNLLALVALSCLLIFTSCKKEKGGTPDHLKIVPANSAMVMSINAKELVEKGGLDKYKDFEIYKKAIEDIAKYELETKKIIDEFLKDTRVTGLNLDQIYMYIQPISEYDQLFAFTFGVENSSKVGKWFTKVNEINDINDNDEYEIVENKEYSSLRLNYSNVLIWDKTKAILLVDFREDDEEDMPGFESLLSIDEEYSIISNADFMECYNTQKDFTIWMSLKGITEVNHMDDEFLMMKNVLGEDWVNASMDFSMNFTKEKATLSYSIWPSSLVEKYYEKFPILNIATDQSLLSYFPEESFLTMKSSINIAEYYKAVVTQLNQYVDKLKEEQGEDIEEEEDEFGYYYNYNPITNYTYMKSILSTITSSEVSEIISLFKGDIIAGIFGFQEGMMPIPQFGIAVTINGEQAFNKLLGLIPEDIVLVKTDSYYTYSIPHVMELYAGQKGDAMYITNSKEALDNFYSQGYKNNLGSSDIAADIKNNPAFYSLNLDIKKYPAIATTMLRQSMGSMEYGMLSAFIEPFSSLNMNYAGKNTVEMSLILKNSKENSLKVIFEEIDHSASRMMGF